MISVKRQFLRYSIGALGTLACTHAALLVFVGNKSNALEVGITALFCLTTALVVLSLIFRVWLLLDRILSEAKSESHLEFPEIRTGREIPPEPAPMPEVSQIPTPEPLASAHIESVTDSLAKPPLPWVAFVDDDAFLRKVAPTMLKDAELVTFSSPEIFLEFCSDPITRNMLSGVILDHYFGEVSPTTGLEVAARLRQDDYRGITILLSDGQFEPNSLENVDIHLSKGEIPSWRQIRSKFKCNHVGLMYDSCKSELPIDLDEPTLKHMHAKARHDIQGFLNRIFIATRMLEQGVTNQEIFSELAAKLAQAARYWRRDEVQRFRPILREPKGLSYQVLRDLYHDAQLCFGQSSFWNPAPTGALTKTHSKSQEDEPIRELKIFFNLQDKNTEQIFRQAFSAHPDLNVTYEPNEAAGAAVAYTDNQDLALEVLKRGGTALPVLESHRPEIVVSQLKSRLALVARKWRLDGYHLVR